jgi:hybrid cluster-associated redox disulfide protein
MYRKRTELSEFQTVDEVMRRWPPAIRVFLDFKMGCVGCPIGSFHSVADACREHGVKLEEFLARLNQTIAATCS